MTSLPPRTERALAEIQARIDGAWDDYRNQHASPAGDVELARSILERPNEHDWPLVDAALDRLVCTECGFRLGAGPRGCPECDFADGFRFAGREVDRPGVPPGNEHATRVSSAVLRTAHRWPDAVVRGNELFLPLFLEGRMPTREEQERFDAAVKRGLPTGVDFSRAGTFAELVELASRRA